MSDLRRILKPGGRLVLTIDLFLDLEPFSSRHSNKWGTNIDLAELDLEHYFFGGYPACAQCLVLKK